MSSIMEDKRRDKTGGDSEGLKMDWCWQKQEEGEGLLVASLPQAPVSRELGKE